MIEVIAGWVELIVKSLVVKHGDNLPETPRNFFKRIGWLPDKFKDELKKVLTIALTKVFDEYPVLVELNLSDTVVVPLLTPIVESALYEVQLPDFNTLKAEFDSVKEYEWELVALENSRDLNIEKFLESFYNHLYDSITATMGMNDRAIVLQLRDEIAKLKDFIVSVIQVKDEKAELARMNDGILGHLHEDIIQPHQIASGKIFVSYSRKNRDFAKALYAKLVRMGFTLWRDVHDIEAGADDWWQSIQEAIGECETVILCMSMFALKSSVVGDEWFYARTLGKRIIPVVVDEIWKHPEVESGVFTIPNWMTRKNWMDFRENTPEADNAWANLIRTLKEKYETKRFIDMVGELPPRFVRRPEELDYAVRSLVDDNNDAVVMTTVFKGAGGYGKTTLAKAVARDIRIQGAFDDGILWVTLGEELLSRKGDELKNALIGRVLELINALGGERPVIDSLEMARTKLSEAIGDLYILLVIDDVWDEAHLKPFLVKTKHSACLITTRNSDAIRDDGIAKQDIDKMKPIEAVELLGAGIDPDVVRLQDAQLRHLARELRQYPLVLALANTQIVNYMTDMRLSLADAIQLAQETLDEQGVLGFDDTNVDERTRAVSATLDASIRQLKPEERQRMYKELAIFPEDAVIPLTTLEKYWGLSKVATLQFCQLLYRKTALLHSFEGVAIRIHDVFHDYLIRQWTSDELRILHKRLITNYDNLHNLPDTYSWHNIAYHLIESVQLDKLRLLLLDYLWLNTKLYNTNPNALITDCSLLPDDKTIKLLTDAITLISHILMNDDEKQYFGLQLSGRLWVYRDEEGIANLYASILDKASLVWSNALPNPPYQHQADGVLKRTLQHPSGVLCVAYSPDGKYLATGSSDNIVRVWDIGTGVILHTLTGHEDSVWSVAWDSTGTRLATGSGDNMAIIWDIGTGEILHTLTGHKDGIWSVAWDSTGTRLATGSYDTTIRVWDIDIYATKKLSEETFIQVLEGHSREVNSVAWDSTGTRLATGSYDSTVRVWNVSTGTTIQMLTGHTKWVRCVAWDGSGTRLATGSGDNTARIWDVETGITIQTLTGHNDRVWSVAWDKSGTRLATGSGDNTARIWDVKTETSIQIPTGHNDRVWSVAWDKSGTRLATGSSDNTARIWDVKTGTTIQTLTGHNDRVWSVVWDKSGTRLVTGSDDNTVRIWDVETGTTIQTLTEYRYRVNSVAWDGSETRLAIGTSDGITCIWDVETGITIQILRGHTNWVNSVVWDSSGTRLATGSYDSTVRVWDVSVGTIIQILAGHNDSVWSVAWDSSGTRLATGSSDNTACIWDVETGVIIQMLIGHTNWVNSVAWNGSGTRLATASSDRTARIWDVETGQCLAVLQMDLSVVAVAWSPNEEWLALGCEDGRVVWVRVRV